MWSAIFAHWKSYENCPHCNLIKLLVIWNNVYNSFKGSVSVISSYLPRRWQCPIHNGTLETFIWYIIWEILSFFKIWKCLFVIIPIYFPAVEMRIVEKPQLKVNSFQNCKHWYLVHTWSDKAFKGTVGNRALLSLAKRVIWNYVSNLFKEEKVEKLKLKKAIEKGNMEVAKIHAENAIRWLFDHFLNSNVSEKNGNFLNREMPLSLLLFKNL